MKIAIATENDQVAMHFGRCPGYTIIDIDNNIVTGKNLIPNPGHEPGFLPAYLAKMNVNCIIAGGMGGKAQNLFTAENIQTILGAEGHIDAVLEKYLAGELISTGSACQHPEGEHDCNH